MMKSRFAVMVVLVLMVPGAVLAANNLTLKGGALFPVSDWANTTKISPYFGLHFEFQDVNALGQTSLRGIQFYGGYALLLPDDDFKSAAETLGQTIEDGGYFDAGMAVRVYSKANSAFVGVGGAYVGYDEPGPRGYKSGFGLMLGLGLANNAETFRLELEARANVAWIQDRDTIVGFFVLLGIGLPF
jgi:hypothetical protein